MYVLYQQNTQFFAFLVVSQQCNRAFGSSELWRCFVKWFPVFLTYPSTSSSRFQIPRRSNLETLKVKATRVLEALENTLRRDIFSHWTGITGWYFRYLQIYCTSETGCNFLYCYRNTIYFRCIINILSVKLSLISLLYQKVFHLSGFLTTCDPLKW
jgi:hypothetical protein